MVKCWQIVFIKQFAITIFVQLQLWTAVSFSIFYETFIRLHIFSCAIVVQNYHAKTTAILIIK